MQQRASVPPPGLPRLQVRAGSQQSVDHGRVLIVQGCPHRGRVLPALLLTSMRAPARQKDHCAKHLGEPAPRRWPRRRQHRGDERQRSRRQRRNPRSTSRRARDTIGHQRLTLWAPAPAATRAVRPHLVGTTAARDRRHSPAARPASISGVIVSQHAAQRIGIVRLAGQTELQQLQGPLGREAGVAQLGVPV